MKPFQWMIQELATVDPDGRVHYNGALVASGEMAEARALELLGAIAADGLTAALEPGRFAAVLCPEGEVTTDDREIAVNALMWRELPMPLTNAEMTGDDHMGPVVGSIDGIERVNISSDRAEIRARGSFDMGSPDGREALRLVTEQIKRWVSIDVEIIDMETVRIGNGCSDDPDLIDILLGEEDCRTIMRLLEGRIMGAAMCAFSAFPGAVIVPEGAEIPAASPDGRPAAVIVNEPEQIAAAAAPVRPPAAWFEYPEDFSWVTASRRVRVEDDGRVFGVIAEWGDCHIGFGESCVEPPYSRSGYEHFLHGAIPCDCPEGSMEIGVGQITMATGHADLRLSAAATKAHYDHTGTGMADVTVGEDERGIWFAGALRPDVTELQVRTLRASGISGDWRNIGGHLELVAALAVNVPGFQRVQRARVASGRPQALIAGAMGHRLPDRRDAAIARLIERVETLEQQVGSMQAERMLAEILG